MPEQVKPSESAVRELLLLLRDEEAVGSNPATPTLKQQVKGYARSRHDDLA